MPTTHTAPPEVGALPAKPTPAAILGDDFDYEPGCRCASVAMAPCGWCEDGGTYDACGNPVDGSATQ